MKHLHNNSKNLNLKHQGTNISTFVSIDTAGSGLKFVNKFKFLPTDSLGRTLFDKRDSKVVQVKINPMYASRMHGERRALPLLVVEASAVGVGSFVALLNRSTEVSVLFDTKNTLPQVNHIS